MFLENSITLEPEQPFFANISISFQCNPEKQFTCWSGDCIKSYQRCNRVMDCNDRSDEHNCTQIRLDKDKYIKEYTPGNPSGSGKLEIGVSFDVTKIVEINEPEVSTYHVFSK